MQEPNRRTAIVAGATGLIGSELLQLLLDTDYYTTVVSLTRSYLDFKHDKLLQFVIDFDRIDEVKELLGATDIYCCLGTTMKKAGSKEAFRKVDFDYPLQLAKLALENESKQFFLVSALGADTNSMFFYNQVKGELEDKVKQLGYQSVHIFQPSLLLGAREEQRTGEQIAKAISKGISFALAGPLKKYKPIEANTVATAMYKKAMERTDGVHTYSSNEIEAMI